MPAGAQIEVTALFIIKQDERPLTIVDNIINKAVNLSINIMKSFLNN